MSSKLEKSFGWQLMAAKAPPWEAEHRFHGERKFRFDFAWPAQKIAVEIQGAIFVKGAHSTGTGLQRDYEKNNLAVESGWRVLYFDGKAVNSGSALSQTLRVLGAAA